MNVNEIIDRMVNAGWTGQAVIGGRYPKGNGAARRSLLLNTRTYKEFKAGAHPPVFREEGSYSARLIYVDFKGTQISDHLRVNEQQGLVLHTHTDGNKTIAYLEDYRQSDIVKSNSAGAIPPNFVTNDHPEEVSQPESLLEGSTKRVFVNRYERKPEARLKCIRHYGTICSVCEFDFAASYGDLGKDFIHVHHLIPLSKIGREYEINPIRDLRPVCPNCHAMLHRGPDLMTVEELRAIFHDHIRKG